MLVSNRKKTVMDQLVITAIEMLYMFLFSAELNSVFVTEILIMKQ